MVCGLPALRLGSSSRPLFCTESFTGILSVFWQAVLFFLYDCRSQTNFFRACVSWVPAGFLLLPRRGFFLFSPTA